MTTTASDECREAFEQRFSELDLAKLKVRSLIEYIDARTKYVYMGWKSAWNRRAPVAQAEGEVVSATIRALLIRVRRLLCGRAARGNQDAFVAVENIDKLLAATPAPQGKGEQGEAAPVGWKLVPVKATPEMCAEGLEPLFTTNLKDTSENGRCGRVYARMVDAAPPAPAAPQATAENQAAPSAPSDSHWRQAVQDWVNFTAFDDRHSIAEWIKRRAKELADGEG